MSSEEMLCLSKQINRSSLLPPHRIARSHLDPRSRTTKTSAPRKNLSQLPFGDKDFPGFQSEVAQKIHSGEMPFACSVCGKSFSQLSRLKSHERIHLGEKHFATFFCDQRFPRGFLAALPSEEPRKNPYWGKPFASSFCDQRFSQGSSPKRHEKFHPGEMPLAFSRHEKIRRGDPYWEKPFARSSFSQSQLPHLKNHEKIRTGEKPFASSFCDQRFPRFQSEEVTKKSIPGKCLSLFCTGNRIITGNRISTGNRIICTGDSLTYCPGCG
ncbi:unnamed protein product [Cyprideis torosa]|uniref:Uncharacterized protein n=1 Tax=Cyprideis torosa TaxID=163714 RepID=A0A7R8WE38_9CRUS|nr:unnamed protein product [Cyprideis torosa]CAG0895400.1 unnamed protein product [Cyprideis torosa]